MFWIFVFALILIIGALKLGAATVLVHFLSLALMAALGLSAVLAAGLFWLVWKTTRLT
jgi:hypothetical protein